MIQADFILAADRTPDRAISPIWRTVQRISCIKKP